MRRGKKYQEALKLIDRESAYAPPEAIALAKKTAPAKFDETAEPHGLGKRVRVLVFAEGEAARNADQAGADFVGADDLIKRVEEGWTDFDVALAARDIMGKVSRLGRVLGPRGLVPNPRC